MNNENNLYFIDYTAGSQKINYVYLKKVFFLFNFKGQSLDLNPWDRIRLSAA